MTEEETYEDTLNGTGWIPGWPGTLSHGARIIRNALTHEIVKVLPPRAVEETTQLEEPAQEPLQDAPQEAQDDNPIQVHIAVVNTSDVPPEPVQPQSDTLQDAMQRLGQ